MSYRATYVTRACMIGVYEIEYSPYVHRRFVGRCLHYIRPAVEIAVRLRIYEWYTTRGILTVLECLDDSDAAAVTSEAADGKRTTVEYVVEFAAVKLSVKYDTAAYVILFNQFSKSGSMHGTVHLARSHSSHNMEKHVAGILLCGIILAETGYHPVETVPIVHFGHSYQMDSAVLRTQTVKRNAVKIDTVADVDSALSEYLRCIGERNHGTHAGGERAAEYAVDEEPEACRERKTDKLAVVRICGNLGDSAYSRPAQTAEQAYQPWIGIHETAGIYEVDSVVLAILVYTSVADTAAQSGHAALTVVCYHVVTDIAAAVARRREGVIAHPDIMSVLTESLHLTIYFLAYSARFRKAVIHEEEYSHFDYDSFDTLDATMSEHQR